jgi:translation elongation factor P/translation initiation factor 5A
MLIFPPYEMIKSNRFLSTVAANALKPGMIIKTPTNNYLKVVTYQHLKQSHGKTSSIVNYLDLSTLNLGKLSVSCDRKYKVVELVKLSALVQYFTESHLIASDATTFDEISIPLRLVEAAESVLSPGTAITIYKDQETIVRVGFSKELFLKLKGETF